MKKIFTLALVCSCFVGKAQVDGTLDPNFGNNSDGTSTNFAGTLISKNQKLIVLPNKKILQVFSVSAGVGNSDFGLALYDSVGNLDPNFNPSGAIPGIVTTDFGGDDYATSVAVQPNGIIVVAGYSTNSGTGYASFAISRYDSLGRLDTNFHSTGKLLSQIGQDDRAYSVALQPVTEKIIVAGFTTTNFGVAPTQVAVARYDTSGNLDPTFNAGGTPGKVLTATNGKNNEAYAMALQSDGKIVIAGDRINTSGNFKEFLALRYTTAGVLDATFGGGTGYVSTKINVSGDDYANGVAIQNDGKIVAAGTSNNGTQNRFALARYSSSGVLDAGFNDPANSPIAGTVVTAIGSNDIAFYVAQQLDNKLVVAGATSNGQDSDFAIARYNLSGTLDSTFNNPTSNTYPPGYEPKPGVLGINFQFPATGFNDVAYSFGTQGTKLVVGGISSNNLALARLYSSSSLFDPLPIRLYSFTATKESNSILLNWQTASEINTAYFDIQRSSNGIEFTSIGKVDASGNSATSENYSYRDEKPFSPINFYRLRIVDNDRKQTFSKVLTVHFDPVSVGLLVYPNPVRDALNIQLSVSNGSFAIRLFDASGRLVKILNLVSSGGNTTISLDMGDLKSGIYFIKVKDDYVKVIKQ